jgi:hypothetical protein
MGIIDGYPQKILCAKCGNNAQYIMHGFSLCVDCKRKLVDKNKKDLKNAEKKVQS